jgi:hypothetical protein
MRNDKKINQNYIIIFILTTIFITLKYCYSFFFFREDFFITKILLETTDIQYYPLVESLSRFDLSPSFNNYYVAKKNITFPFLSLIWHAILFKSFGYYSFIILEFVFKFLTFIILYKIFRKLHIEKKFSIFFSFIILTLPSLFNLMVGGGLLNFKSLELLNQLINSNLGNRFPRPLVTFFYLSLFLYFLICFFKDNKKYKIIYILPASIVLFFLANSFFYLFISCGLLLFILLILRLQENLFFYIKNNILVLFCSVAIILIGLVLLFFQSFYGEPDYSRRIGLFEINLEQKIFLFKYFFLSLFRLEIIILIFFSFTLNFFSKKVFLQKNIINILNIYFHLFTCSIISPFAFVFLSSKVISLYHFFDLIIFAGVYYVFLYCIIFFYCNYKSLFTNPILIYILFFICCFVVFFNNRFIAVNITQRQDINLINSFLMKNNIKGTGKILFTNDLAIINLWLHHKNKYLSVPEGFSNSLTDSQVEQSLFSVLKSLNIDNNGFKKFLNLKLPDGRSFFSLFLFTYKYQANSLKYFSDINNYLPDQRFKILKTSPLRATSNVVPENEKLDIIKKYQSFNNEAKHDPDIIIVNKNVFIDFHSSKYLKIYDTINFSIYLRV